MPPVTDLESLNPVEIHPLPPPAGDIKRFRHFRKNGSISSELYVFIQTIKHLVVRRGKATDSNRKHLIFFSQYSKAPRIPRWRGNKRGWIKLAIQTVICLVQLFIPFTLSQHSRHSCRRQEF